ncbi:gonadotropin-releasing hormone II receptor-like isoform X2 [Rana temporaria]|uniref:gonadotropin-releasing hormone II receptor-like isoform X2 n=1 Tax=Rana temporaria TaxID=8407 RepID=UPI001AACB771|nr:gonadotropin-releasing hormone II receptor-like isoform X2 [Rana temporaria]
MNASDQPMGDGEAAPPGLCAFKGFNLSCVHPNGFEKPHGPNITFLNEDHFVLPTFSTAAKIRVAITCVLFISSACFNMATLWTITYKYRKKSHIRILIINLVAADLLITFVVMPLDAVWNVTIQWYAGDVACRILMFLKLVAMYSSAFVTVVISLDRHAAILNPLGIGDAKKKNKAMLSVAWTLSLLLATPQVASSREVNLRRSYNNIPRARMRTFKMSLVIVLTFIVCWTPYYLLGIWYWFSPEMLTSRRVPPSLSHILFLFGLFNTCLDPIIYGLFTIHFRREIRRVCRCATQGKDADATSLGTGSFRVSTAAVPLKRSAGVSGGSCKFDLEVTGVGLHSGKCEHCKRQIVESFM